MARLSEYASFPTVEETWKLSDIAGEEVTILNAKISSGEFGDFVIMSVQRPNGDVGVAVTGAQNVVDAITHALERDAFPLQAQFYKQGRMWAFR
jgi:hypothetical protein